MNKEVFEKFCKDVTDGVDNLLANSKELKDSLAKGLKIDVTISHNDTTITVLQEEKK